MVYLVIGGGSRDDLGAFDELVSKRMIAVMMRVEECVDMRRGGH
jgi:hypothetical protein